MALNNSEKEIMLDSEIEEEEKYDCYSCRDSGMPYLHVVPGKKYCHCKYGKELKEWDDAYDLERCM